MIFVYVYIKRAGPCVVRVSCSLGRWCVGEELHRRIFRGYFCKQRLAVELWEKRGEERPYSVQRNAFLKCAALHNKVLKSWRRSELKESPKVSKKQVVLQVGGDLQRCFGSSALPVESVIIVWVHVYSNLRHRLQRTHLRTETQK